MGGALSPHSLRKLSDALPGIDIHIGYGQTETSPRITNLSPSALFVKRGSCGVPIPGVAVEIVDDNGSSVPAGVVGEIVVSGPNVMSGYISGDEITSGTIDRLGRLHTGDLGKLDDDGYLYIVGRKSEMIKCAGERVFPREAEAVLETHPAVCESAALGLPDKLLGERLVACVVTHDGASVTAEELRSHCLNSLPLVRAPREIRFCSSVPKTASGKVDRSRLAEHFLGSPGFDGVGTPHNRSDQASTLRVAS
jgi:acyl-CoA synthetase (AMP-forming)/AMP-acid ligase II